MARATIVWNEHPTEVVAGFHARKVAEILRERYGHDVRLRKLPYDISSHGILRDRRTPLEQRLLHLAKEHHGTYGLTQYLAGKERRPVFNFHASPAAYMAEAEQREPQEFRVSRRALRKSDREIQVIKMRKNVFVVELPARFHPLPRHPLSREELRAGLEAAAGKLRTREKAMLAEKLDSFYHARVSRMGAPEQKKFLHPRVSEIIAAEIHRRLMEK
ncbi:MAG: hypothetical protein AB1626_01625 [Candidatus Micrarchaeota archaeon]